MLHMSSPNLKFSWVYTHNTTVNIFNGSFSFVSFAASGFGNLPHSVAKYGILSGGLKPDVRFELFSQ